MSDHLPVVAPRVVPPLDPGFRPAVLAHRHFDETVAAAGGGVPLVLALERANGARSRYEARVFPETDPRAAANLPVIERLFKFLLWQWGGWRVWVGGPRSVADHLRQVYSPQGARAFDCRFMGEDVYERPFEIIACAPAEVPPPVEESRPLGRHLDGCRIGFDLGASDRKVSAVIDGRPVYAEEVIWTPVTEPDPAYHYREILTALRTAAAKMPRVDAIGGSAAGVYVDNTVRVASLFRSVPRERYGEVRTLFLRLRDEMGVPLEVANDGDVTALAGSMSLDDHSVLGVALGSSEATGYVDEHGNITGWLNELAFAPVDYQAGAPVDEWSGEAGVGAQYLSQQCVFRLAPRAGLVLPTDALPAERLRVAQERLEAGDQGALRIWQTMGVYLGYAIAHYARFYRLRHVLVLGRCTSGEGGRVLIEEARRVLAVEFPDLAGRLNLQLPDERSRRVGQAVAAASLPALPGDRR